MHRRVQSTKTARAIVAMKSSPGSVGALVGAPTKTPLATCAPPRAQSAQLPRFYACCVAHVKRRETPRHIASRGRGTPCPAGASEGGRVSPVSGFEASRNLRQSFLQRGRRVLDTMRPVRVPSPIDPPTGFC